MRLVEALQRLLIRLDPSSIVALSRVIASRYIEGPGAAIVDANLLSHAVRGNHLFHATRAEQLRAVGQPAEAAKRTRPLALTRNNREPGATSGAAVGSARRPTRIRAFFHSAEETRVGR